MRHCKVNALLFAPVNDDLPNRSKTPSLGVGREPLSLRFFLGAANCSLAPSVGSLRGLMAESVARTKPMYSARSLPKSSRSGVPAKDGAKLSCKMD